MEHRADVVTEGETAMSRHALKLEAEVRPSGRLELDVPLPVGSKVEVVVLTQEVDEFGDLVAAAASSTDVWDILSDDAEWNNG